MIVRVTHDSFYNLKCLDGSRIFAGTASIIPSFMENLTPQNCFHLGEIYHKSIMEVCAKVDALEAIIKEMETKRMLKMYTIFCKPSDYPNHYVVRRFHVIKGETTPTFYVWICDTLDEARACIPDNLMLIPRDPDDAPALVESWV